MYKTEQIRNQILGRPIVFMTNHENYQPILCHAITSLVKTFYNQNYTTFYFMTVLTQVIVKI